MLRPLGNAALLALVVIAAPGGLSRPQAAEAIRPGRWEFTSQLQMPALAQLPPGITAPGGSPVLRGGGIGATHTGCIDATAAVPTDPRPECRVDRVTRDGGTITWTSSCNGAQAAVRAAGIAHYSGERMEATLVTRVPQPDGRFLETTQRITGRYLGACTP